MEEKRNNDRSTGTWYDLRTLKKMKLKAKEKINETKQQLFAYGNDCLSNGRQTRYNK